MKNRAYFYAIGRRKTSRATVKLYFDGTNGDLSVNKRKITDWSDDRGMLHTALRPLEILGMKKDVDMEVRVSGGGKQAQADSISLGIARAIVKKDATLRQQLKEEGLLTRDPRKKERKKPGLRRARRAPQFSKR